jgi:hypothetical protein
MMRDRGPIGAIAETVVMPDATGTVIDDGNVLSAVGGGRSMT